MFSWKSGLAALAFLVLAPEALADQCPVVHAKMGKGVPSFAPDQRAGYFTYSFKRPARNLRIEVRAQFPRARQMNVVVYDAEAVQTDWRLDAEIEADAGSVNPFRNGVAVDAPARGHTLRFRSSGQPIGSNDLALPPTDASIWIRYYDLRNDADESDAAFLPKVFVYDEATGAPAPCPEELTQDDLTSTGFGNQASKLRLLPSLKFYRFGGDTFFSNPHNAYVFALPTAHQGEAAVVRLKAPTFLNDRAPNAVFTTGTDVRFWSYCVTDLDAFYNCLADRELKKDKNGNVTIVIGEAQTIAAVAAVPGVNLLQIPASPILLMHYVRQLNSANFPGSFLNVERDEEATTEALGAYAPAGTRCGPTLLKFNLCGIGKPPM